MKIIKRTVSNIEEIVLVSENYEIVIDGRIPVVIDLKTGVELPLEELFLCSFEIFNSYGTLLPQYSQKIEKDRIVEEEDKNLRGNNESEPVSPYLVEESGHVEL